MSNQLQTNLTEAFKALEIISESGLENQNVNITLEGLNADTANEVTNALLLFKAYLDGKDYAYNKTLTEFNKRGINYAKNVGLAYEKPLAIFDIESTGLSTEKDQIVQLVILKFLGGGKEEALQVFIKPTIASITAEAQEVHGISIEQLVECKTFAEIAPEIAQFLEGCDISGYNIKNFDIPLLSAEFARVGIDWPQPETNIVDVLNLNRTLFPNNLEAVHERLTGLKLEGAHDALNDCVATKKVLDHLLYLLPEKKYGNSELQDIAEQGKPILDFAGKLCMVDGKVCFNFGKHQGQPVKENLSYAQWMLGGEFPANTKTWLRKILAS